MWRPKNWHNIYEGDIYANVPQDDLIYKDDGTVRIKAVREEAAFEIGADAGMRAVISWIRSFEEFSMMDDEEDYDYFAVRSNKLNELEKE